MSTFFCESYVLCVAPSVPISEMPTCSKVKASRRTCGESRASFDIETPRMRCSRGGIHGSPGGLESLESLESLRSLDGREVLAPSFGGSALLSDLGKGDARTSWAKSLLSDATSAPRCSLLPVWMRTNGTLNERCLLAGLSGGGGGGVPYTDYRAMLLAGWF